MQDVKFLRLTEIFYSLQGESNTVGLPTVFIRLTGCPLRCVYCDTKYAMKEAIEEFGDNKPFNLFLSIDDFECWLDKNYED